MTERFLAKSNPPESIREHTQQLLDAFEALMALYGDHFTQEEREVIRLAAEYHDYGKMNLGFQNKLAQVLKMPPNGDAPETQLFYALHKEIPHGYLSPSFLNIKQLRTAYGDQWLYALINAIYYHHTRDAQTDQEIIAVIEKDLTPRLGDRYALQRRYLSYRATRDNPPNLPDWEHYALVKGTLNRLDYAASSQGKLTIEIDPTQNGVKIDQHIEQALTRKWQLRDVQQYMKAHRTENLAVIASTGIGKTEAALLWGGDSKLFYTLPLKISINAIYKRIIDEQEGYGWRNCVLLHSDALSYLLQNETADEMEPYLKYQQARFFAYPVTICTVDQLFIFVFRFLGSEIIPSVLKYSKVVIDEIQAYSPEIVARILVGLKIITDMGGKFAIITATFPPVFKHFMDSLNIPYRLDEPFLSPQQRHFLEYRENEFDFEEIAANGEDKKVLVLCNTVKRACAVYEALRETADCPVHLLHSRFQKRHRDLLETAILEFSDSADKTGIWVSTQIVEASLDIDFDLLYTEMCPADSLLQRLGRCYRKRDYLADSPNVFVHDTQNGVGTVYPDKTIYQLSVDALNPYCGRIFTEADKLLYINAVYAVDSLRNTEYFKKIFKEINTMQQIPFAYFSKDDAQRKFRDIVNYSVIPEEQYLALFEDGLIEEVREALHDKDLPQVEKVKAREKLMAYTVSVGAQFRGAFDATPIDPFLPVFRIRRNYEFDEDNLAGVGLTNDELVGDNMI